MGCGATPNDDQNEAVSLDAYSGRYNVTYLGEGTITAIADAEIDQSGHLSGMITALDGTVFSIGGTVQSDGTVIYTPADKSQDFAAQGEGLIDANGIVEGSYTIGEAQGLYFGFRYQDMDQISSQFDGSWSLEFTLDDQPVGEQTIIVDQGEFAFHVDALSVDVSGVVLDDGRFIAQSALPSFGSAVLTAGQASERDFDGVFYTLNGDRGIVHGTRE